MELSIKTSWGQSDAFLRIIDLAYKYHSLKYNPPASLDVADERHSLVELFEGDPEFHRRQYRRFPMRLPAALQTDKTSGYGIVLNFSGNGLFVASKLLAPQNSMVQLKLGQPGELEFLLHCKVRHLRRNIHFFGLGCELCSPPQELLRQEVDTIKLRKPERARLRPFVPFHLPVLSQGESLCCLSPA